MLMNSTTTFILFSILSLALGCSAPTLNFDKFAGESTPLCRGSLPNKKYSFLLSSYRKIPPGMPVDQVKSYSDTLNNRSSFIANNLPKLLLSRFYIFNTEGKHAVRNNDALLNLTASGEKGRFALLDEQYSHQVPPKMNLAWAENESFVTWDSYAWGGSAGPGVGEFEHRSDGACDGFLAYFDPPDNDFGCGRSNVYGPPWFYEPKHGLLRFIRETGFQGGSFLFLHYFGVPERERRNLCSQAGLAEDCFVTESKEKLGKFVFALRENKELQTRFPFLTAQSSTKCGYGNDEMTGATGCQLERDSALALDLVLIASTKVTKKIEGDWVRYQVTWDPTLVCKYAKDKSDLITH